MKSFIILFHFKGSGKWDRHILDAENREAMMEEAKRRFSIIKPSKTLTSITVLVEAEGTLKALSGDKWLFTSSDGAMKEVTIIQSLLKGEQVIK